MTTTRVPLLAGPPRCSAPHSRRRLISSIIMTPWQRFGQHQHMQTRRSPFRTRSARASVAALMGPSHLRSASYLARKRSMTSLRAAASLGLWRTNGLPRMRFLRSMSTAISPGPGLPGRRRACCRGGWNRGRGLSWGALLEFGLAGGLALPPARRRGGGERGARPHGEASAGPPRWGSRFRRADLREKLRVKRALRSAKLGEPCDGPADPRGGLLGREGERPPSPSVSDRDPRGRRPATGFVSGFQAASRARPRRGDARHPKHPRRLAKD